MDILSKSDPQCFVFLMDAKTRTWCKEPVGKTEMVLNKLECEFVKSIIIDYRFESIQPIRFTVVDVDNQNNPSWQAQELVGHFDTEVGKISKAIDDWAGKRIGSTGTFRSRISSLTFPLPFSRFPFSR